MTTSASDAAPPGEVVHNKRRGLRVLPAPRTGTPRVAVIGGGIAGLTAAHSLLGAADGRAHVTVFEADGQVGGKLQVSEVAGVPLDEGAEGMQSSRPEAVGLARSVGLDRDIVHPEVIGVSLWTRDRLRQMPPTFMGVPTDLRALTSSGVLPLRTVLRLPLEYAAPATRFENDVSVGAFVESRLGRKVVDALVEPILGGVYAGRADALSMQATVPALFRELRHEKSLLKAVERTARGGGRSAGARRGPVFAGIRGGVGRLPQAVAAHVESLGGTVRTGVQVQSLHRLDDHWRLIVASAEGQEVVEAEEVIVALPPHEASALLAHICPPAANDLGLIDMSSMAVVGLAYPADAVSPMSGSGFLVSPTEGRMVKAATYASCKWDWIARAARTRRGGPGSMVMIRASIGRLGEEDLLERDDADLVGDIHEELAEAIGISRPPIDFRVTRWMDALPQYATGHVRRVERIRSVIAGVHGLELCGAAFDGVGVAAVVGGARVAAEAVAQRLQVAATGRG
ncbi:MAG: protoporphyrinogen oxidase [Candidatus Nanopelagicales bacterium]|nr:protoporphyrinogen oxidase [Candidatus Nanopelagicales bacterium]MDZ4250443.1 protoporphyrinogen oxidase [Candidatus Nanopelagicales bacterium]